MQQISGERSQDHWSSESLIVSPTAHFLQDFPLNDILTVLPIQTTCRKIRQGHLRVMIYIYIVVLESLMLHMPSLVEIGPPVLREKIFKGFNQIWPWQPSWSCDLDYLYTHWFPLPIDASYKIWL